MKLFKTLLLLFIVTSLVGCKSAKSLTSSGSIKEGITAKQLINDNHKQKFLAFNVLRKLFLNLKPDKQIELLEQITETKTRKNYSEIFFGLTTVTVSSDQSLKRSGSFLSPLPVFVFVGFGVDLGAPQCGQAGALSLISFSHS